jgi:hypothetical protein
MDGTLQSPSDDQGCGVVRSSGIDRFITSNGGDMDAVNWVENLSTYDIKNQQFIKHIKFDKYKFIVRYHRLDEDDFVIDEVMTLDEQDITDLLSCRTLDRIERKLK